jgi:hypothetical protein
MSTRVDREERRLRRIFARALWLAAPAALPLACSVPATPEEIAEVADAGAEVAVETPAELVPPEAPVVVPVQAKSCAPVAYTPSPPDTCGNYIRLPCGLPAGVVPGSNCFLWLNDCQKICPGLYFNCHAVDASCVDGGVVASPSGAVDIDCSVCNKGVGRVPAGLARARMARATSALGAHFAVAAHLESASVHAFRRLGAELAAHGAPAELVGAARCAQRDEVRHARVTGRLARRFGGAPARPRVERLPVRPLDEVAIENAVEGCVRETYGALVASYQAAHARDPEIARVMGEIAVDEIRHAALSWAVARWAASRLDADAHARMAARCVETIAALRREADAEAPCDVVTAAGLPGAEQQRALLTALEAQTWSALL